MAYIGYRRILEDTLKEKKCYKYKWKNKKTVLCNVIDKIST